MTFRTFIKHVEAELALSCPGAEVRTIAGRHCWRRAPYEAVITLSGPAVEGLPSGLRVTLKELARRTVTYPFRLASGTHQEKYPKLSRATSRTTGRELTIHESCLDLSHLWLDK